MAGFIQVRPLVANSKFYPVLLNPKNFMLFGNKYIFHLGDIGEMRPDGILKIIDRKKNIFKLSQGEYVAVEFLEKTYKVSPFVEDVSFNLTLR